MKKIKLLLLSLLAVSAFSQHNYVHGFVRDSSSYEPIIGAAVYLNNYNGVITNEFGYFGLNITQSDSLLNASYLGYRNKKFNINKTDTSAIEIFLSAGINLKEIEVNSRLSLEKTPEMSALHITMHEMDKLPSMAEPDVIKKLQLLPGVQGGEEARSGLYVRGGSPDQNLFLIDGLPIYNVNHIGGLLSVFQTTILNNVKLYKGAFPARFGSRVSSVVDVTLKEGNKKEHHGQVGFGLASGDITLEGPIDSAKTSYIVSFRRFWYDLLTRPVTKFAFDGFSIGYGFYDFYGKISHQFSPKSRLFLSTYAGDDKMAFTFNPWHRESDWKYKSYEKWGNQLISARWNYILNKKTVLDVKTGSTRYHLKQLSSTEYADSTLLETTFNSNITDFTVTSELSYSVNDKYKLFAGLNGIRHAYEPGFNTLTENTSTERYGSKKVMATESSVYVENLISPFDWFNTNIGLRYNFYYSGKQLFTDFEPRITVNLMSDNLGSLKASYSKMMQPVHLLSLSGIGLPTDLWVPSVDNVKPVISQQYVIGYNKQILPGIELSLEAYKKDMANVISYKEGAYFYGGTQSWKDKIEIDGVGRSMGVEMLLRKTKGKATGWISYTLAKSERKFDNLNNGAWYPYKFDRRHDISYVGAYSFSDNLSISATWMFGTSYPVTLMSGKYFGYGSIQYRDEEGVLFQEDFATLYSAKNNLRFESIHRLDLGINYKWINKKGKKRMLVGGIYNAYSRMNASFYYYSTKDPNDSNSEIVIRKTAVFPIVPTIKYVMLW